jgi:hypothetical protein
VALPGVTPGPVDQSNGSIQTVLLSQSPLLVVVVLNVPAASSCAGLSAHVSDVVSGLSFAGLLSNGDSMSAASCLVRAASVWLVLSGICARHEWYVNTSSGLVYPVQAALLRLSSRHRPFFSPDHWLCGGFPNTVVLLIQDIRVVPCESCRLLDKPCIHCTVYTLT